MDLQLLLSSSMDKTVRLWDLESKSCLKLFAHNDYGKMPPNHVTYTLESDSNSYLRVSNSNPTPLIKQSDRSILT
jgi:WD40 repeat protein